MVFACAIKLQQLIYPVIVPFSALYNDVTWSFKDRFKRRCPCGLIAFNRQLVPRYFRYRVTDIFIRVFTVYRVLYRLFYINAIFTSCFFYEFVTLLCALAGSLNVCYVQVGDRGFRLCLECHKRTACPVRVTSRPLLCRVRQVPYPRPSFVLRHSHIVNVNDSVRGKSTARTYCWVTIKQSG